MSPSNVPSSDVVEEVGHEVDGDLDELEEGGKGDSEAERENSSQWTPETAIALQVNPWLWTSCYKRTFLQCVNKCSLSFDIWVK